MASVFVSELIFIGTTDATKMINHTSVLNQIVARGLSTNISLLNIKTSIRVKKTFICNHPQCGIVFLHYGNLVRYKRTHTREFPCKHPKCGKSFTTEDGLIHHQFRHAGEKSLMSVIIRNVVRLFLGFIICENINRPTRPTGYY